MQITESAPAKINLTLRVFDRREDGYHRVETVMAKLGFGDHLAIEIGEGKGISLSVPGHPRLEYRGNLATQAARAYLKEAGLSKKISMMLTKETPVAAGLGGGSSDAAAVLRGLQGAFGALSVKKLWTVGRTLGADVPFFLQPSPIAIGRGIGDDLTPGPVLPPRPVVLVNPGFTISTPKAYEALDRSLTWEGGDDKSTALRSGPENWNDLRELMKVGNDLQGVMEVTHPEVAQIRKQLSDQGAEWSQMSGSGPTVFGLFTDRAKAVDCARRMQEKWWAVATEIASNESSKG